MAIPTSAQAQTTLVSNLSQSGSNNAVFDTPNAQGFTTGSTPYRITSVQLNIAKSGGTRGLNVELWTESEDRPAMRVFAFNSPATIVGGTNTFTVPDGDVRALNPNTKYFIKAEHSGGSGDNLGWVYTEQSGQSGLTGWSIHDNNFELRTGGWHEFTDEALKMAVLGEAQPAVTVTDVSIVSRPASGDTYAIGEEITLEYTFSEEVEARNTPHSSLWFDGTGSSEWKGARYRSGSGTTRLRFVYTVRAGDYDANGLTIGALDSDDLGADKIKLRGTEINANHGHAAQNDLSGHKVDGRLAALVSTRGAVVSETGRRLTLTFDREIASSNLPPGSAFTVLSSGSEISVTSVSSGTTTTVVLALGATIRQGETVTVSYTDPTSGNDANAIQRRNGNDVASFSGVEATNESNVTGAPGAPTSLTARPVGGTRIDLTWTVPSDPGDTAITGYRIEWSADGSPPWNTLKDTSTTGTTYSDTGLSDGTTRYYRVRAINSNGIGDSSDAESATTDGTAPMLTGAAVTVDGTTMVLTFDEEVQEESFPSQGTFTVTADGVDLEVGKIGGTTTTRSIRLEGISPVVRRGQSLTVGYVDPTAGNDTHAVQDLAGNDLASFQVSNVVVNGSGVEPRAPDEPEGLVTETVSSTQIDLRWKRPQDNGGRPIRGYQIERSDTDGGPWVLIESDHDTMDPDTGEIVLRYSDTGLPPGAVRFYRVAAVTALGRGSVSETARGRSIDPVGTVALSVGQTVAEGGRVTWTVTATTERDRAPGADLEMVWRIFPTSDTASRDTDFIFPISAQDTQNKGALVRFRGSDFRRQLVDQQWRYRASRSGNVTIVDDVEIEHDEVFRIDIEAESVPESWVVQGASSQQVTIEDSDTWSVELTAEPSIVAEAETRPVTLTAKIVPTGQGCVARFPFTLGVIVGGTASSPEDYTIEAPEALEMSACQASATWTLTLASKADLVTDDGETVSFTPVVTGADAFTAPRLRRTQVTIDEAPGLALNAFSLNVEEGRDTHYTVVLTQVPSGTVTVTPSVSGDSDVTTSGPLTFTRDNWSRAQRITVSAAHDSDDEDDAATIGHVASGADYRGVTGADVRINVDDDERSQGLLTARLTDGAEGASSRSAAPTSHDGRPFRIRLHWSHVRTDGWQSPERAIGASRAIRVTGADVRAVRVHSYPIGTVGNPGESAKVWRWDQAALILEFTPQAAGTDVTMVLEPLPCPGVHALCAWDANHRYTGLEKRMRWTVEGVGTAPETAPEVTLSTRTEPRKELLLAQFTSVRTGSHYRVQLQGAGGDWTGAREWTGSRAGGGTQLVTIDGVDHALRYDVRVRWENRQGAGPWSEVRTYDPSLAASLPPQRIWLNQREPWGEALLGWTPNELSAGEATVAKQQYRLARFPGTIDGFASGGRGFSDNAWRDIPDSGTDQANEGGYVITGIGNVWEVKVQMRTVNSDGVVGPPSGETEIAHPGPTRANAPPREVSNAGPDGVYGIGETIAVELRMSRPVQVDGSGTPSIEIDLGGTTRTATLSRIHHSNDHFYYGLPYPPWGRGDTVRFEYVVAENDGAPQGFAVPAGQIRTNGAQIVNAMRGGSGYGLPVSGEHSAMAPGRPVRTVRTAVTSIEWYGHQVWMHFDHDLDPRSRIDDARSQLTPAFSVSNQDGVQAARPVTDARIVRGRGSTTRCGRGETGCRTVQLALGQVYRPDPLRTNPWWDEPAADETVWMSYTPHAGLPKLRLRDTAGHDVEAFSRVQARALSAGTDPVLSVSDARGREGGNRTLHFQVRMVPPATNEVRVDYATSDGTALAGQDYTARSGTLTFAPGETVKSVGVPIIDDALEDSGEILSLTLANPSGARIGDGTGTGTIFNSEDLVQARFASVPESHDGSTAFTVRLTFGEELPASTVSAETLRDSALVLTNATVTGVEQVDAASRRDWEITLEPASDGEVSVALAPKESCAEAGAICAEDGRGLAEAVSATVPGPEPEPAPPVRVVSASVTTDAGANGTWDAGEEVVAALRFSDTVTVTGSGTPTLGVLLDGARREAAYAGGSGTDTLTFRLAVAAEDAGAGRARLVANGLALNASTILDGAGRAVDTGFAVAPWVTGVELAAAASGDGVWTPGEAIEVRLAFSEAVTVTVVDGPPSVGVTAVAAGADAARRVDYASGSGSATLVFRDGLTDTDGTLERIVVTADSLALAGGRIVSQATGLAAETGHDGTAPPTALAAPRIAGVAQVGGTLEASFAEAPGGTLSYRWLRGAEEIADATASTYAPVAADVGEVLSVRVESGGASVTSAPSAPVWPAPVNPPLAAGEEEVFSATLTLGSWDGFPARIAGYSRALDAAFGEMDETAFEDGGTRHAVDFLVVNENGQFALATGATGPEAAGLAAYWNGHRIAQFEARTLEEGLRILVGRTPQSGAAYMRYMDGSSDGVRVAVSLRRASAAQPEPVTPHDGAPAGLTAVFAAAPPDEHDGTSPFTFRIAFSENLDGYSYKTLRDSSLTVMQGTARLTPTKVGRVYPKDAVRANTAWTVEVTPQSKEDISIGLGPSPACDAAGAMCTADDRALSNELAQTVLGPPGLSVADATVREAEGATMDFVVTLSRASVSTVTVSYATSAGSAAAGSDYTEQSGTLTFAPEETSKTVAVAVLADDIDDGGETFTLTLSNPSGGNAYLADATATGTIENTGAMPRAWLGRFGRTVAGQVLDAVEGRFAAARAPGAQVSLAGAVLGGAGEDARAAFEEGEAGARREALSRWVDGAAHASGTGRAESRALTGEDFFTGTAFTLTGGTPEGGYASVWGRGAMGRFDGREGELTLDGEVASVMLGADISRDVGAVGLMLTLSRGEGSYRGAHAGEVRSTLTGLYPYGRYALPERVAVWGVAGYGAGTLTLTPKDAAAMEADMRLMMGAVGVRGVAVEAPEAGGVELAVTSDAMAVRTTSERTTGMMDAEADVTRLRLGLEGTWHGLGTGGGGQLVPRLELGVRHDGGDAETGFGADVGAGLAWSHPASGLTAQLDARGLLAHEAGGLRERGIAGSLGWDPRPESDRGPSLTLTHTVGAQASGGMDALLGRETLTGLAGEGAGEPANRRLELTLGYGVAAFGGRFTATPEVGVGLGGSQREYRVGWRLGLERGGALSMDLGVEATRRESASDDGASEHGVMLRGRVSW